MTHRHAGSPAIETEEQQLRGPFEDFYRREYHHILAIARAVSPDRAAAEDLAQESFAAAHRHWRKVSEYDDPRAWVRRVMINRATSMRRRVGAELRAITRAGHDPSRGVTPELTPATTGVWEEVRRLPKRQRQAIVLHYVGELSTEEIGEALGCSPGAVKSHLHRGREALRGRLADWIEEQ
jgi:RNA polymerase sigma-70 factor (ECF subfamily)